METTVVSSEFDIFAPRPVHSSVLETGVDQKEFDFLVTVDNDTYIDTNINLFVHGKLTDVNGADLNPSDFTGVTNSLLHSLFGQCTIALNGETVTPAVDYYNNRAFFETILTYASDAAVSHLTNGFWYLDDGDLLPCDPTGEDVKNMGFVERWNKVKRSKEVQLYSRIHSDICNMPRFLPPCVRIQIRLTKAKSAFYLTYKDM